MAFAHVMSLMMRRGEEASDFIEEIISLNNWHPDRLRRNNWIFKIVIELILCHLPELLLHLGCFAIIIV